MNGQNGGNPRLDRVEKIIEGLAKAQRDQQAQHRRQHAEHRLQMSQIRAQLKRGIAFSVKESRKQRKKSQDLEAQFDKKITQLSSAQLTTEEKLKRLISALEHGRNGH